MNFENRTELLESLPKHGTMAEVGVLHGAFSNLILGKCTPTKLYLVDCWTERPRDVYADYKEGYIGERMYRGVLKRFASQIEDGSVEILRGYSEEAADRIFDESLDFVYLDADHSYKGCLADIEAYWPKVKVGGIMAGHDYDDIKWSQREDKAFQRTDWGVVSAVNEFFGQEPNLIPYPTKNWWVKKTEESS